MEKKRLERDRSRCNSGYFSGVFRGKKGQLTIFIILGIILVLALVLVVLMKKEVIVFRPEEVIPTEKGKIENYITACISGRGQEALFLIGLQGGYVEVPREISGNGNLHLRVSPMNVVPYWAYGKSLMIPSLEEIKLRVDRYMEENLRECLLGTEAFSESYNIIEKSGIKADTEIVDKKVLFKVKWNLEIRDKGGEIITEVIDHLAESPIKLKRVYETAKAIGETEMRELKLEDITQDLIALENPKVPVAGVEISCSKKRWKAGEVKEALKDMLRVNIRELKIKGTEFVEFPDSLPYYQNHYVWDLGEGFGYPEVSVVFNFDNNYPFLFYVTPQRGGLMESGMQGGSDKLAFLCIQNWKFTYDVVYPVLVRVRDETTGYNFQMALTVHLVRNTPNRGEAEVRTPSNLIETVTDEDYCRDKRLLMLVKSYELVESEKSGEYWREPLEGVKVSFTCLKYRCEMGETEYGFGGMGDVAAMRTNFPYCVGGILRGEKEGYKESWKRVVSKAGEEVELELVPLLKFPAEGLKVVKHEILGEEGGRLRIGRGKELEEETAMIKLVNKKKGEVFQEINWASSPELDKKVVEESMVEFLGKGNFEYEVEIYLFEGEEFKGGYKGNWTAEWKKLAGGKEIIFHTVSKEGMEEEEMFELMINLEDYSKEIPLPEIR